MKKELGNKLKEWRKRRNHMTQEDLATASDLRVDTISMIERGINFPSRETLERMSKVFEIPIKDFLTFDSESETPTPREETINKIIGLLHTLDDRDLKAVLGLVEGFK